MVKICEKCHHTMPYDPYFKVYMCRQCGHTEEVKRKPSYKLANISVEQIHAKKQK